MKEWISAVKSILDLVLHSKIWKYLIRMLLPLLVVYIIIYISIIVFSFVIWEVPPLIPIPFTGNFVSVGIDRSLIIVGLCLVSVLFVEEKGN